MEPLAFGDYPFSMRAVVRERLPTFSNEERETVKNSYDFIGINYYTTSYARNIPFSENFIPKYNTQESFAEELGMFEKVLH